MATITRWDPVNEMLSLREAMSQLFEDSYVASPRSAQGSFAPALDLSESEDGFLVEMAIPGLKPEDLQITFENNVLTVKGQVHQAKDDKKRTYHRTERRYGSFQRSITLPITVKGDSIQAALTDGILRLEIPKAEEVKPRRITVNVAPVQPAELHNN